MSDERLTSLFARTTSGMKPGLGLMRELVEALDHPERSFLCVHVAGTNGKGSVCAMVESVLRQAGLKTGLFTSPHLVRVNERIRVDGLPLPDSGLLSALSRVEEVEGRLSRLPTFFETLTAMAFLAFREEGVQVAVIETGLGGRLDSTNVVEPLVCGITRIDLDHREYLGDTLTLIAGEKAGILKPGRPAVMGQQEPEALEVLRSRAEEHGCPLWDAVSRVVISGRRSGLDGQKFTVCTPDLDVGRVTLPMLGAYQMENLATAVTLSEAVFDQLGLEMQPDLLKKGLSETAWAGRGQVLSVRPPVLLDVAHNPGGALALRELLRDVFGARSKGVMVWSSLRDKEPEAYLKILAPLLSELLCVELQSPRAMSSASLLAVAEKVRIPARACSVAEARVRLPQLASGLDFGCVAGSVYLAGEWMAQAETDPGERLG